VPPTPLQADHVLAKTFAEHVEQLRCRHEQKREQSKQGISPAVVQRLVHVRPGQRQEGAKETPQEHVGGQGGGGGLGAEEVDQVDLGRNLGTGGGVSLLKRPEKGAGGTCSRGVR
jgi:hypothetical protein